MFRNLLLTAATVFIFSACSNSLDSEAANPPIRNAKPGAGSLTVVGDSLAAGYGAKNEAVKPAECIARGLNTTVQDYSVAGLTSSQVLARADLVQASRPKVIFVSSGGNDAILDHDHHGSYPVGKTLGEMSSLFERLLDTGAVVVYLGLTPPFAGGERLPQVSQLARGKGIIVVDGMRDFWGNPNLMLADGIHPNDLGYSILCQRVLTALKGYYP